MTGRGTRPRVAVVSQTELDMNGVAVCLLCGEPVQIRLEPDAEDCPAPEFGIDASSGPQRFLNSWVCESCMAWTGAPPDEQNETLTQAYKARAHWGSLGVDDDYDEDGISYTERGQAWLADSVNEEMCGASDAAMVDAEMADDTQRWLMK